ncbi:MAG: hypothetical protein R3323_00080 [Wenzhouxiangellaceae bacterium]|nr:hypothetical protein [Wenzhouxiangellaceae bacterium]
MNRFACLLLALAVIPPAGAADEPPSASRDAASESVSEEAAEDHREDLVREVIRESCRDEQGRPESWLDRTHSYLSERLCEPAAWFDGFFGGERADEETPVGSFFRVRNSVRWDQTEDFGHEISVSANISLPRISDRVRLLVSRDDGGDGEADLGERRGPGDDKTRLGLRFLLSEMGRTQFDVDGTVKVASDGLNPRVQGRARHTRGLTDKTLARLTQTVFWERDDGYGTTSRADWEWLPSRLALVRLTARGTWAENIDGMDWRTGLIGFRQLNRETAIRSEIGAFGFSRPGFDAEEYFVNFRFRRSFLRSWLFYEIQPEYAWPVDQQTGRRRSDLRMIFTLEVQFENAALADDEVDHYRGR